MEGKFEKYHLFVVWLGTNVVFVNNIFKHLYLQNTFMLKSFLWNFSKKPKIQISALNIWNVIKILQLESERVFGASFFFRFPFFIIRLREMASNCLNFKYYASCEVRIFTKNAANEMKQSLKIISETY